MKKKDLALDLLEMALARKDEPVALASALIALDRLASQRPDHAPAHYASGRVLILLGRYQLALGAFRLAARADPTMFEAPYYEAICHWFLGHDAPALELLDHACYLDPSRLEPWYDRGQILANLGEHALAHDAFAHAHALRPDDFATLKKLLQSQIRLGRWEAARISHAALRKLWAESEDPAVRDLESYVLDQFEIGEQAILALETFAPRGDPQVAVSFAVTEAGRLVFSLNLESSVALRAAGYGWTLVVQDGGLRVDTGYRYHDRPAYPLLRRDVELTIRNYPALG